MKNLAIVSTLIIIIALIVIDPMTIEEEQPSLFQVAMQACMHDKRYMSDQDTAYYHCLDNREGWELYVSQ